MAGNRKPGEDVARKYIKVFYDWARSTAELSHEEKGRLIDALIAYAQGQEFPIPGNERFVFPSFALQIDRDAIAYEEISEKRKAAGAKGGKQKQANISKSKQTLANASNDVAKSSKSSHDHDHDHDHDEEEDNIFSAASSSRPDFNTLEAYASNNLLTLSPGNMEELEAFKADLPEELIRFAIDEACAAGKRSWAYARSILNRYHDNEIKNIAEARQQSQPKHPTGNGPKWADPVA